MGSKSPSVPSATSTTQTTDPWSGQQGYLSSGFAQAANLEGNYTPQYYPNSTVAGFNPTQVAGLGAETQFGAQGGSSSVNASNNALTGIESGNMLSAGNPYFQSMANAIGQGIAPTVNSSFESNGRYGSGANVQALSSTMANTIAPLAFQNYQSGLNNVVQGAALTPGIQSSQLQGIGALQDAGTQEQQQSQSQLNDLVNRFNYGQMLPYNQLQQYESGITGNYGSTSQLTQPYSTNGTANKLGGALGGAGIGSLIGGSNTASKGLGALAGLGLSSDRRLKRNIKRIGKADNGLPIYAYQYIHSDVYHIGFMADEVEALHPEAVGKDKSGFKLVDYAKAVL